MHTEPSDPAAPTKPIPFIIHERITEVDKTREMILSLAPDAVVAEKAVEVFGSDYFESINTYASHLGDSVWICVRTKSMTPVIALRRYLASKGYHISGPVQDYPDEYRQVFCLGRITLNVRFPGGEGATCKFVPVGTKTVPVYELVCDGAEVAP